METPSPLAGVLADVGPRRRRARNQRGMALTRRVEQTGISQGNLSGLESGQPEASIERLLAITEAHQVPLDELVG